MSTTLIYVEVISIGAETMIWILLLFVNLTNNKEIFNLTIDILSGIGSSLIFVVLVYALGCIFDRAADLAFLPIDKKIRTEEGLETSCFLVDKNEHQAEFLAYTRMRMRILRASAINLFIIGVMLSWYVVRNDFPLEVVLGICAVFLFLTFISIIGAIYNMRSYYKRVVKIQKSESRFDF